MRKILFLLLIALVPFVANAQALHNYYCPQTGMYVQVGVGNGYIQFGIHGAQPTRLNYIGFNNNHHYYGVDDFQVAIPQNPTYVFVITGGSSQRFNYVGTAMPSNNMVTPTPSVTPAPQRTTHTCPWCNGTGRITKNDHVPQYGTNSYVEEKICPECGLKYTSTYTNHYHLNCGKCGGTGKITN